MAPVLGWWRSRSPRESCPSHPLWRARPPASATDRQADQTRERDARLDAEYAAHPERYNVVGHLLSACHQTTNFGPTANHYDSCAPGFESVLAVVTGTSSSCVPVALKPSGSMQRPPRSAVVFPNFRVGTMLGGAGPNEPSDEFEMHDCRIPISLHGSVEAANRGVYVRSEGAVYDGAVVCDHVDRVKGSAEWHTSTTCSTGRCRGPNRAEPRGFQAGSMRGGEPTLADV